MKEAFHKIPDRPTLESLSQDLQKGETMTSPAPQSSRKTPETDAAEPDYHQEGERPSKFGYVPADFCRSMERQRDEAQDADKLADEQACHIHAVLCGVNGLLQMVREHFIEEDGSAYAKECLTAQLKIKHALEDFDKWREVRRSLLAPEKPV